MNDPSRSNAELIEEIFTQKQRIQELERSEADRKQAEEALKEREETLQAFFDAVHETMVLISPEGTVKLSNAVVAQRLGTTVSEFVGTCMYDHFPPEVARYRKEQYERVIVTGEPVHFQDVMSGRSFEQYCYPVFGDGGMVTGVAIFAHNITDRKRAEQALRESEERYRIAIEGSLDGIAIVQKDVHVYVNQSFLTTFGYTTLDEILGKPQYCIVHPDDHERVTGYAHARQSGETVLTRYEFKGIRKDGTPIDIEVSVNTILYKGKQAILAYLRDVTERKLAEKQINASLREKEVLLREIHHRVKNNLQVISSLLNMQARHLNDPKDADIFRASIDRVKSMALIHDKLHRSESLANIYFPAYVDDLVRGLVIDYTVGGEIGLDLRIDPVSFNIDTAIPLGLILNELVSNSLKHAFPDDRRGVIAIGLHRHGKDVVLTVSDNGIGFPMDIDLAHTQSLGMQLVVMLVEQLEGAIELKRNEGTEFRVVFKATA